MCKFCITIIMNVKFLSIFFVVLRGGMVLCEPPKAHNLVEVWSHLLEDTEKVFDNMLHRGEDKINAVACPGCGEADRMHALRLQLVQNQILSKLRLRTRPAPMKGSPLPAPVAAGHTLLNSPTPAHNHQNYQEVQEEVHSDDFYSKMDQKIIFPDDDPRQGKCDDGHHPTACFSFTMPKELQPPDVSSAELWMYKEQDPLDGFKQTFVVSEAAHWDPSRLHTKTRPVAIVETDMKEGWMKAEVGWASGAWLESGKSVLAASCPSCGAPRFHRPVASSGAKRPFLVINTRHSAKKRRVRQLDCAEGVKECCRERLYVSFADLGWDDWILQPSGYHAYFCRGDCSSVAAVTLAGSNHHSVIKKIFHGAKRLELKPCCTPTTFSPLQLFYRDTNHTVTQATLPNMIVESCGCM